MNEWVVAGVRGLSALVWFAVLFRAVRTPERSVYANRPRRLLNFLAVFACTCVFAFDGLRLVGLVAGDMVNTVRTSISAALGIIGLSILFTPSEGSEDGP